MRGLVLRHGLTPWNAERRFQGQADIELTETGHLDRLCPVAAGGVQPGDPDFVNSR